MKAREYQVGEHVQVRRKNNSLGNDVDAEVTQSTILNLAPYSPNTSEQETIFRFSCVFLRHVHVDSCRCNVESKVSR